MKFLLPVLGFLVSQALSTPTGNPVTEELYADLGADAALPETSENPLAILGNLEKRACRSRASDTQWGCDKGWCWRTNCGDAEHDLKKRGTGQWCWLAYEGGHGGWTPCGRWQDCKWSWDNKNAKCGIGKNCGACGCGC